MAIKVIRICDICGAEKEQIIDDSLIKECKHRIDQIVSFGINFECSDCLLKICRGS